ncbi:MAG TPA: hypothetical protein EYN66_20190 [Myxococcales bacterium]|nr:hypothetical protein [Myxococcales bacterium]
MMEMKIMLRVLCVASAFWLAACGGSDSGSNADSQATDGTDGLATAGTEGTDATTDDGTTDDGTTDDGTTDGSEPCTSNEQCGPSSQFPMCKSSICDTVTGQCVEQVAENGAKCGAEDKCGPGGECEDGECVVSLVSAECNDDNVCTEDTCDPATGCVFTAIENCCVDAATDCGEAGSCVVLTCEENSCVSTPVVGCCTSDEDCGVSACATISCQDSTCVSKVVAGCCVKAGDCDDGDDCTLNGCISNACVTETKVSCKACTKAKDCNDNDGCTEDTCVGGFCSVVETGECMTMTICQKTGKAGDIINCDVNVAATSSNVADVAVGLQFKAFPVGEGELDAIACMDEAGNDSCAGTSKKLPTGHFVQSSEKVDYLLTIIFDLISSPLNDAVLTPNGMIGSPYLLTLKYKLTADGDFKVEMKSLVASDTNGKKLLTDFVGGVVTTTAE